MVCVVVVCVVVVCVVVVCVVVECVVLLSGSTCHSRGPHGASTQTNNAGGRGGTEVRGKEQGRERGGGGVEERGGTVDVRRRGVGVEVRGGEGEGRLSLDQTGVLLSSFKATQNYDHSQFTRTSQHP
ncbi:hypothetical protein Pcinc_042979 [Petrolisthes cinctipes]|uniref:Uncharacterized protein n=1 Tax=Petrolisthes cinctipes TaxID=88211 RepID=A0AAE1BHL4_PETCI|nr:hypothetical protein Pcinc_042979 [Petrolisthes cinctipes]